MQYRVLGKTGLKVSEIGFGAWGIGGGMWGKRDDLEAARALRRAFDLGINFYDTARVYGGTLNRDGHSEKLIGKFIKEIGRDRVIIASKIPPKNYQWPARMGINVAEVFPRNWIIQKVDESLKALDRDTLDLMQFHVWQDDFADSGEWKETIQELTGQGKVKYWGLSLNDYQPENCRKTIETGLISTAQLIFNIFHQKPIEMLPFFKKHNIGVIARVPLDEGGLTGKITSQSQFGDFRDDYFKGERKREVFDRAKKLQEVMGVEAKDLPELALRFLLTHLEVSTVIPGMRTVEHVNKNVVVSDSRFLSSGLVTELKNQVWERNFY